MPRKSPELTGESARLLHYSAQPFAGPVKSTVRRLLTISKPCGLWLSVEGEDDWPSWCQGAQFCLDQLQHVSEIILKPRAKILRLANAADIDRVTAKYSMSLAGMPPGLFKSSCIGWRAIADEYDGIIIAPYIWQRRLEGGSRWYYGWDCASGCIWRPRAIADIRPVLTVHAKAA